MATAHTKPDFAVQPTKGSTRSIEHIPAFWNPNRQSIRFADDSFMTKVKEFDEGKDDLRITWNPINERWQVFYRNVKLVHPICSGWTLLFIHSDHNGGFLPLDERVFARLWSCSARKNGPGKAYFERIEHEMERDKEKFDKQWSADTMDAALPSYDHAQIQISMRGKSNGSKFADFHA
jgi:hypothetical protein